MKIGWSGANSSSKKREWGPGKDSLEEDSFGLIFTPKTTFDSGVFGEMKFKLLGMVLLMRILLLSSGCCLAWAFLESLGPSNPSGGWQLLL